MYKIKLGLFLFIMSITHAYAQSVQGCISQQSALGRSVGQTEINMKCLDVFEQNNPKHLNYIDEEKGLKIIAGKSAIYMQDEQRPGQPLVNSGNITTLYDIIALDYSDAFKEIYIIENNSFEIKVYTTKIFGNVAPLRIIQTQDLIGAIDLTIVRDKIFVLNPQNQNVIVYNRQANFKAREGYQKLDMLALYEFIPNNSRFIEYNEETKKIELRDINKKLLKELEIKTDS